VDILCAPAESVGPWSDEFRLVAQTIVTSGCFFAMPDSLDRIEERAGTAGMQSLVAWAALDILFTQGGLSYEALLRRPQTLSMLCQWIAHTPNLGPMSPTCPGYVAGATRTLVEEMVWKYTGDFKDPNSTESMAGNTVVFAPGGVPVSAPLCLSPPQFSSTYLRVRLRRTKKGNTIPPRKENGVPATAIRNPTLRRTAVALVEEELPHLVYLALLSRPPLRRACCSPCRPCTA
jgi:hypothetical protein